MGVTPFFCCILTYIKPYQSALQKAHQMKLLIFLQGAIKYEIII